MPDLFKKKELKRLREEAKSAFEEYIKTVNSISRETVKATGNVNSVISVINSERNFLRDEIHSLYNFLSTFEDMGKSLTPFDLVIEPFFSGSYFDASTIEREAVEVLGSETQIYNELDKVIQTGKSLELDKIGAGLGAAGLGAAGFGAAGFGAAAAPIAMGFKAAVSAAAIGGSNLLFAPVGVVVSPLYVIILGILARNKNKKKILKLTELLGLLRMDWAEKVSRLERFRDFVKNDAPKIANLYRGSLAMVKDAIKYHLVPEIQSVRCFFLADALKENIIYNQDTSNVRPNPVSMYKDTPYHRHYQFVLNSHDFYDTIYGFFTKAVLTDILNDVTVSEAVQKKLEACIDEVKRNLESAVDNIVFCREE